MSVVRDSGQSSSSSRTSAVLTSKSNDVGRSFSTKRAAFRCVHFSRTWKCSSQKGPSASRLHCLRSVVVDGRCCCSLLLSDTPCCTLTPSSLHHRDDDNSLIHGTWEDVRGESQCRTDEHFLALPMPPRQKLYSKVYKREHT